MINEVKTIVYKIQCQKSCCMNYWRNHSLHPFKVYFFPLIKQILIIKYSKFLYEAVNYPVLLKLSVTPVLASVGVVSAAGLHSLGAGAVLERAEGWTDCLASRPSRSHQAQSSQLHNPCSRHTVVSSNQQQLFFLQGHYNIKTYLT